MYENLHCYVDLDWEDYIDDPDNYLSKINKIVQLAYQHRLTVFYSKEKVKIFTENCNDLDIDFVCSTGNRLYTILEKSIPKSNISYPFKICFSQQETSLLYIDNLTLSIIDNNLDNALISISTNCHQPPILLVKSNIDFQIMNFDIINDATNIIKWIQNKSDTRTFNLSPKHGENGRGNWKGESVLRCSKNDAQQFLNTAIADFSEKEKRLFNFDHNHKTFIEFFYEGDNPQKQWHGFHVEDDQLNRIPLSIRRYFGKN
jgi:hypothetical protein